MLQQTRAQTVVPYWERFLRELPTVQALAETSEAHVLSLWSGLGYYRRARMLQAAARRVVSEYGGRLPGEVEALRRLEGVGAYTAGAVASIAFGRRAAAVDGNVARVLARLAAVREDVSKGAGQARIRRMAEELVPQEGEGDPGRWNEALMELGATVCTPRRPSCNACPVAQSCRARELGIAPELPRTGQKKSPRAIARAALVLRSRGQVLLARRKGGGLFGGLWEAPSADGDGAALMARLGIQATSLEPCGEVVHVLSHRRLVVAVSRATVRQRTWPVPGAEYDGVEWVQTTDAGSPVDGRPHATLTKKVLIVASRPSPQGDRH